MPELRFGDDGYLEMGQFDGSQDPSAELFLLPFVQSARDLNEDVLAPAAFNLPMIDRFDGSNEAAIDEWDDAVPTDQLSGSDFAAEDDAGNSGSATSESPDWSEGSADDGLF